MTSHSEEQPESAIHEDATAHRPLIECMLMMGAADGVVQPEEVSRLARTVSGHPLFADFTLTRITSEISHAADRLVEDGFEARLAALAQGLQSYTSRLLALAFATGVSFADGKLADEELVLLKTFQRVFALRDDDVAEVVDAVQDPDADITGLVQRLWEDYQVNRLTREQAFVEVMLLMAAADGEVQKEEATQLALTIASREEFAAMSESDISSAVTGALGRIQSQGEEQRLNELAGLLPGEDERLKAMMFAYSILVADGVVAPGETACLARMQQVFGLSSEDLRHVLRSVTGADEEASEKTSTPASGDG